MVAVQQVKEELNPFEIAKQQFDRAADYLELEDSMRNVLRAAKRQLIVSIPVKMDGGETQRFLKAIAYSTTLRAVLPRAGFVTTRT